MAGYYTIRIPWVPRQHQTEWHPTCETGAFSALTRGSFRCPSDAIDWARGHLGGTPYELVFVAPDLEAE